MTEQPKIRAAITGVGAWVPPDKLTNADLEKMVDTSDEWITTRTGIKERRILKGEGKGISAMAVPAVKVLLEKTGVDPAEIDLVICATVTPDMIFPATANIIAHETGMTNAFGFDVEAACSSFLYSLTIARAYIEAGHLRKVVVVGADKMSAITDYQDRTTCILFGDAAAAVLLEPRTDGTGIIDTITRADGVGIPYLYQKAGGSKYPPTFDTVCRREHYLHQEGRPVFKFAVTKMAEAVVEIMERNRLRAEDIAYLVPHQANLRIIEATAKRMGIPRERAMINIQRYGNTTNATIPLALYEWERRLRKGDNLILATFGGGFTWGSIYLKWAYDGDTVPTPSIETNVSGLQNDES